MVASLFPVACWDRAAIELWHRDHLSRSNGRSFPCILAMISEWTEVCLLQATQKAERGREVAQGRFGGWEAARADTGGSEGGASERF